MNELACQVTTYFLNSLWEVAVIGGVAWIVARLLRRLGAKAEHVTWVATLGLAILAPMLPLFGAILGSFRGENGRVSVVAVAAESIRTPENGSVLLQPFVIEVLAVLYLGVLFYWTMRLGWMVHGAIALVREAESVSLGPDGREAWERAKRGFCVKTARILVSKRICSPVVAGLVDPVLLVPEGFVERCSPEDFLVALAHECAHIQRRDFPKNLFYEMASLVCWLSPSDLAGEISNRADARDDLRWHGNGDVG